MLEFIVLGRLPGFSLELTFNWLLLIFAAGLLYYDIQHIKKRKKLQTSQKTSNSGKLRTS